MRTKFTFLPLVLVAIFCAVMAFASTPTTNAPVLKVDYAHWMSKQAAGSSPYPYHVKPCPSVILDFTDFSFQPPDRLSGKSPNLIRVSYGDFMDGTVHDLVIQSDKKRYELSAATLPKGVSPLPFSGFRKDFEYVVSIGILETNGTFNPEWVGFIEVR